MSRSLTYALAGILCVSGMARAQAAGSAEQPTEDAQNDQARESDTTFGEIKAPDLSTAKLRTLKWLKDEGKANDAVLQKAEGFWSENEDRPILDRVVDSLLLAYPEIAQAVRLPLSSETVPTEVPESVRKHPNQFFRANISLYYAKLLVNRRRVYEEAADALKGIRPEHVVDPAALYFLRAVATNKILDKKGSGDSIDRLFTTVAGVPERYTVLSSMMKMDMESWKDKQLSQIARKMGEVEGRLANARGGQKTQEKQKRILDDIDQLIKEMEDMDDGGGSGGGASPSSPTPGSPASDSKIMGGPKGVGEVEMKKLLHRPDLWGQLPEKERVKILEAIGREYPPHLREAIETYLRTLIRDTEAANVVKPEVKP